MTSAFHHAASLASRLSEGGMAHARLKEEKKDKDPKGVPFLINISKSLTPMKTHYRYLLGLLLAFGLFATSFTSAQAFVGISVGIAPPPLPVYAQPACPDNGYIWTPGYWAWDSDAQDYYWVPGAWVLAPEVGYLWTPCWWGWADGAYCFHPGYWGESVGFYGGINYGYGYNGHGYAGGHWHGHDFYYNRSVSNVNGLAGAHTFSRHVDTTNSRVSFNGHGGTTAVATLADRRAESGHHLGATSAQNAVLNTAKTDPSQRFSSNHGEPRLTSANAHRADSLPGTSASAATGATHHDSALTGESRSASEHHAQVASAQHHTAATHNAGVNRTASIQHSRVAETHAAAPVSHQAAYHASSFHQPAASHPAASISHAGGSHAGGFAHASVAHASAPHAGGGGGHAAGGGHAGGGGHH
jgi:hypothetical protein